MTEKRFTTVELPKPNKWGIWYDGAYLSTYQVCILLNEYVDVKKMNEELKIDVNSLITHYNGLNAEYEWLKEENVELKKENNNLKKALWEAEENYLYQAYHNNSARREDKLKDLKEDFKRGYWND